MDFVWDRGLKKLVAHVEASSRYPSHPDALHSGVLRSGIPRNEIFLSTKVDQLKHAKTRPSWLFRGFVGEYDATQLCGDYHIP